MAVRQEHPEVRAIAVRYDRAKTRYEELRDELRAIVVAQLRSGARPADISRASGWDREYLRRLKAAADAEDAKRQSAPAPDA